MSALAVIAACLGAAGSAASLSWRACNRHNEGMRVDRDLHEADSLVRGDRAWRLARRLDRWVDNPIMGARCLERAHRLRTGRYRLSRRITHARHLAREARG